ncbi:SpoIIE family protein phosphatase [Streptomyces ureilyticus]|uniref:SpoIIE family protein phosphatase n=1 Tax=Streptomyces ureilyticus TaxID=1775131 RepID=A0ABX0DGE1_9ACTN|nr:SpoIIE family protein phosphatase [Streptomyces ureilyticus]NGO40878.1 SpoIIE family protein phosphatase [Streptomyces ureilyticus]
MAALSESEHRRHAVAAEEDVGALRRAVARMAAGQHAVRPGVAELVATELGTNLLRHAHPGGYVLARKAGDGIELLSVDHGPGMTAAALASSPVALPSSRGGGLKAGLSVVRRNAAEFDWYATRRGTVVYARLGAPAPAGHTGWLFGGVNVPLGGDGESGDAWAVAPGSRTAALVVDGLGHGPGAAAAARAAITTFDGAAVTDLDRLVRHTHEAMRATRGGVLGASLIDPGRGELAYAAVGNITGRVLTRGRSVHLLDRPGTLGTQLTLPAVRLQHGPWEPGSNLILVSDGIRSAWSLEDHPGLLDHHPAIIAAVLHREYGRATDDATVLVVRQVTAMA